MQTINFNVYFEEKNTKCTFKKKNTQLFCHSTCCPLFDRIFSKCTLRRAFVIDISTCQAM